jgi:pyruvate kinase
VPALSEKDRDDLRFAMRLGVDFIALSFVRSAEDILDVHEIMDEFGYRVPVIAKIEKPQAVDNLEGIIEAFDGIMVARGDLGVEMPLEEVPLVQKRAIELARRQAKPVIVATQVLESMIENPRPTRAEASDAANAVLDGADALMLSGETSVGAYPIEAVRTMGRIIENTEERGYAKIARLGTAPKTVGGAVTKAAVEIGEVVDAKFLITFTETGGSAKRMARVRPHLPMLAFTSEPKTRSQLALVWGIETYLVPRMQHTDQFAMQVDLNLIPEGRVQEGERVLIVAGSPPGIPGSTNALRVHRIGDAVNRAAPAYRPEEVTG